MKDDDFNPIPGELVLGIDGSFTSPQLFDFLNNTDLKMKALKGISFYTELPKDSISFIKKSLENLPFIKRFKIKFDHEIQQFLIYPNFFDLHLESHQEEWLQIISDLELSQMDFPYTLVLKCKNGNEDQFIQEFEEKQFVRYAEQNALVRFSGNHN